MPEYVPEYLCDKCAPCWTADRGTQIVIYVTNFYVPLAKIYRALFAEMPRRVEAGTCSL